MKFLVLFCAVASSILVTFAEPVVNGVKTGHTSGHKKNVVGREKYPYVVHLKITDLQLDPQDNTFSCGGTIISGRVILTAAHCFLGTSENIEAHVLAGILHLTDEVEKAQIGKMYDHLIHRDFISKIAFKNENGDNFAISGPNDIALVWLEEHLRYNKKVNHIELMPPHLDITGKKGFVLGWGQTEEGTCSNILRRAELRVIPRKDCEYHYKGTNFLLSKGMLCIKSDDERSLQCKGDSGGPFVVDNKVAGIMSHSFKMIKTLPNGKKIKISDPRSGAVVTYVGYYNSWINNNIKLGPPKDRKKKQNKLTSTSRPDRSGRPSLYKPQVVKKNKH